MARAPALVFYLPGFAWGEDGQLLSRPNDLTNIEKFCSHFTPVLLHVRCLGLSLIIMYRLSWVGWSTRGELRQSWPSTATLYLELNQSTGAWIQ